MKIGVITFSGSKDNYGQLLQCFAMQTYLKKLGHQPFLIRYEDTQHIDSTGFKFHKILKYLRNLPTYFRWYFNRRKEQLDTQKYQKTSNFEKRDFSGFLCRHISCSPIYNDSTIHANPPKADVYICGSDQIWAGDDAYYLSFAPDKSIKIAYAPSLGGINSFPIEKEAHIRNLILRLDKVGMREQSGVDTCQRLGRKDAVKVIDPTLLLDADDYMNIASNKECPEKTAFIYLLGNPIDIDIKEIIKQVDKLGLKPFYVASQGRNDSLQKENPTIEEWIKIISKSDFVITNSFHCTVFALQFHRPFISIPLSNGYERMNTRIEELLGVCGLLNRFTNNIEDLTPMQDEDFTKFDDYKQRQQKYSLDFLGL